MVKPLLNKIKNVDNVLEAFEYDFRPTRNPELTLYDTIGDIDDLSDSKPIDNLSIPGRMKKILKSNGIKKLLPIQIKAINAGLFRNEDLLVVAGTSSGKTLIGELVGISKAQRETKYSKINFFNHKWDDPESLEIIGTISADEIYQITNGLSAEDVNVKINKLVFDYELLIFFGTIGLVYFIRLTVWAKKQVKTKEK